MRSIAVALAACTLVAAGGALAEERPLIQPTRDVAVTYETNGPAGPPTGPATGPATGPGAAAAAPRTLRILYSAAAHRVRVESQGSDRQGFAIMDRTAHSMTVVMPEQQRYIEMPMRAGTQQDFMAPPPSMHFTRKGSDSIAGVACTVWETTDTANPTLAGTACITADGVMLRAAGRDGKHTLLATKVEYGPLSPDLFSPPAGFQKMELPTAGTMPRR